MDIEKVIISKIVPPKSNDNSAQPANIVDDNTNTATRSIVSKILNALLLF